MSRLYKIFAAAALALAVYLGIAYRIASGVTVSERVDLDGTPADFGSWFEEVRFMSRRGDAMLDGWFLPGRADMPVIVFVHGISSTRTGAGMTELASMLGSRGFGALLFDLRGHGRSGGSRMSGGWHERMDVLGACDYLLARGIPPGDIAIHGLSMGAASAALAAAEQPQVAALVLDSPFARASELVNRETALILRLPEWFVAVFKPVGVMLAKLLYQIDVNSISPEAAMTRLEYPVLVICGVEDERIPPEQSRRVYDAAPEGSMIWTIDGIAHAAAFSDNKLEYADRVETYLLARLRP